MCILCVEIAKGHITFNEAFNNIKEMIRSTKNDDELAHTDELLDNLIELEATNSESGGSSDDKISCFK